MMRDLKFKAWDKVHQRMCQVLSLEYWDPEPGGEFILGGCYLVPECRRFRKIEELELLQYTGIKDCKGSDIYEGDIMRRMYRDGDEDTIVIEYEEGAWNYSYSMIEYAQEPSIHWTIIGNVYEHQHLLHKGEQ